MWENAEFHRLEEDFPAVFCISREGSQWQPRVSMCKPYLSIVLAGTHQVPIKHFGPLPLLPLFLLPLISPGCTALEVVVLCSKDLCSPGFQEP